MSKEQELQLVPGDALDRLGMELYHRRPIPREYVGGSDAKILDDAAKQIAALTAQLKEAASILGKVCVYGTLVSGETPVNPPDHAAIRAMLTQIARANRIEAELTALREGAKVTYRMQAVWPDGSTNSPFRVSGKKEFDRRRSGLGWKGIEVRLIERTTTISDRILDSGNQPKVNESQG